MLAPSEPMRKRQTKGMLAPQKSHESASDLSSWYQDELRPKLARAVNEGRVDFGQAEELHRLMSAFLDRCLSHPA